MNEEGEFLKMSIEKYKKYYIYIYVIIASLYVITDLKYDFLYYILIFMLLLYTSAYTIIKIRAYRNK